MTCGVGCAKFLIWEQKEVWKWVQQPDPLHKVGKGYEYTLTQCYMYLLLLLKLCLDGPEQLGVVGHRLQEVVDGDQVSHSLTPGPLQQLIDLGG